MSAAYRFKHQSDRFDMSITTPKSIGKGRLENVNALFCKKSVRAILFDLKLT
ncbi:MAG: hypothetical protein V7L05_01340 [Nostoc sp.]|uniref:hypothetical protein n=1 Tax=Nostoc sp. TaxID=1180 RepID=UPI002FF7DCCE